MWARVHRWLAIVLVAPLVVWSITGLLFHLKPGWDRAYDQLSAERPAGLQPGAVASLAAIEAALGGVTITRLELFDSVLGPLCRVTTSTGEELFDATTAKRRSPLSIEDARAIAVDAVSRSTHHAAYGEPLDTKETDDTVRVRFAGGSTVDVDRHAARLSQRGADTDRIDWLYRIHYLQWTGKRGLDRVLGVVGLMLIWAVFVPGIVLFVRRARRASV
jgi:uncharacterized iron-regulated membrane protein